MESEFVAQLMSITIDNERLAELASDAIPLLAEFSKPIDPKAEVRQRAARSQLAQVFCDKWGVTKAWLSDLIDRYEEQGHSARLALARMSGKSALEVPDPRLTSDATQGQPA